MSHHFARSKRTGEILLSLHRDPPPTCEICDGVDILLKPFRGRHHKSPGKRTQGEVFSVFETHPKCSVCRVFMGGTHAGGLVENSDNGMCSYCSKRRLKYGMESRSKG
jgi:hypothetical protein